MELTLFLPLILHLMTIIKSEIQLINLPFTLSAGNLFGYPWKDNKVYFSNQKECIIYDPPNLTFEQVQLYEWTSITGTFITSDYKYMVSSREPEIDIWEFSNHLKTSRNSGYDKITKIIFIYNTFFEIIGSENDAFYIRWLNLEEETDLTKKIKIYNPYQPNFYSVDAVRFPNDALFLICLGQNYLLIHSYFKWEFKYNKTENMITSSPALMRSINDGYTFLTCYLSFSNNILCIHGQQYGEYEIDLQDTSFINVLTCEEGETYFSLMLVPNRIMNVVAACGKSIFNCAYFNMSMTRIIRSSYEFSNGIFNDIILYKNLILLYGMQEKNSEIKYYFYKSNFQCTTQIMVKYNQVYKLCKSNVLIQFREVPDPSIGVIKCQDEDITLEMENILDECFFYPKAYQYYFGVSGEISEFYSINQNILFEITICDKSCDSCEIGSKELDGKCISCNTMEKYYPLDEAFDDDIKFCYKEKDGYYLDVDRWKQCYSLCSKCIGPGSDNDQNCTECKLGYELNEQSHSCVPICDVFCEECNIGQEATDWKCEVCNTKGGYYPIEEDIDETYKYCYKEKDNYYLDDEVLKKCYDSCKTCNGIGNKDEQNCVECWSSYIQNEYNSSQCYSICANNFYYRVNDSYYECAENSCPKEYPFLIEGKKQCIKDCKDFANCGTNCNGKTFYYLNSICVEKCPFAYKLNASTQTCESENVLLKEFVSSLNETIYEYNGKLQILQGNGYTAEISNSSITNSNLSLSSIEFGDCENILRNKYRLSQNSELIFVKIDIDRENSLINQVEYSIYSANKTQLDMSLCSEEKIKVTNSLKNTSVIDTELAKQFAEKGIDIFNAKDPFFTDICFSYQTENGIDIIISDRRKDFYQNLSLCEVGCDYDRINLDTLEVTCSCKVKTEISTEVDLNFFYSSFKSTFLNSNFGVVKCYRLLFDFSITIKNYGFWIFLALCLIHLPLFFTYCSQGLYQIRNFLKPNPRKKKKENEPEKEKKIVLRKNNKNSNSFSQHKKTSNKDREKTKIIFIIKSKKFKNMKKNNNDNLRNNYIYDDAITFKEENTIKSNSYEKKKKRGNVNKKTKIRKIEHSSDSNIRILRLNNKIRKLPSKNVGSSNINLSHIQEIPPFQSPSKDYLDDYLYESAILYDKRGFWKIYYLFLLTKQPILKVFIFKSPLEIKVMGITKFLFSNCLDFSLSALFYRESQLSKRYHYERKVGFLFDLENSILISIASCIAGVILSTILNLLSNSKGSLQNLQKEEDIEKYEELQDKILKVLKVKIVFYILIEFSLMLFFWYFVSCFCAVFLGSQLSWLQEGLTSFVIR